MQTDIKQPATVDEACDSRKLEAQGLLSSSVLLERRAKWLKENAEKVREYKRRHAKKAYAANYRQQYAGKRRAQFDVWRKKHRAYFKARHDSDVDNLAEWYVRAKLSRKTCIKPSEWPASLVELMRAQLKVKRLWLHQRTSKN